VPTGELEATAIRYTPGVTGAPEPSRRSQLVPIRDDVVPLRVATADPEHIGVAENHHF
jgi:hypothetical protein